MATTGTNTFNLDVAELIEEAFERCGAELRGGYDMRTATRSLNIMFSDWANRGVNLWTIDSGVIPLVAGTTTYTLPADTVDLLDHVIRTNAGNTASQADITISRISASTYAAIPNKLVQGRPIQVLVNRTAAPSITVWPIPDDALNYQFVYWRLRRLQDAGTGANTLDIPFRFIAAMTAGLAYYLALKIPDAMSRLQVLREQYDEAFLLAANEDREKAPIRLVPRQSF